MSGSIASAIRRRRPESGGDPAVGFTARHDAGSHRGALHGRLRIPVRDFGAQAFSLKIARTYALKAPEWGLLAEIWARIGPAGMARRDETRRDTPGLPRPRNVDMSRISNTSPELNVSKETEFRKARARPMSREHVWPRFA